MNKAEFIEQEIQKNRDRFGRWGSTTRRDSADHHKIVFGSPPQNDEEVLQHGNALANTGNYPVGTDACFNVGISGGCGTTCFVYLRGQCGCPDEMIPRLDGEEEESNHSRLYGEKE